MSVEIMENDEQDKQYCKVSNGDLMNKPEGNKHSYFLRAKTPRFVGFPASDHEDGEFKRPSSSSFCKLGSFLSSPIRPHGSKSEHCDHEYPTPSEEEDLANCLVMLSNKSTNCGFSSDHHKDENYKGKEIAEKGLFQCKACKKVFNSHQALGGHRASHKKVKGCFASKPDGLNDDENIDEDSIQDDHPEPLPPSEMDATRPTPPRKRAKMHECSVCRRVFSSGQALGGHKRCHWLTTSTDNAFIPNFHDFQYDHQSQQLYKKPMLITKPHHDHDHDHDRDHHHDHDHDPQLDLNLNLPPAPQHDQINIHHDDKTISTRYEASTRLCLQQWANHNQQKMESEVINNNGEEGSCGMKLRKLSDLRDVNNLDGGWLQMGIASTTEILR